MSVYLVDRVLAITKPCTVDGRHAHCISGGVLRSIIDPRRREAHEAIKQVAARLGGKAVLYVHRKLARKFINGKTYFHAERLVKVIIIADGTDPLELANYFRAHGLAVNLVWVKNPTLQ